MNGSETIVISLGGSIIAPDELDVVFLGKFRALVTRYTEQGKKFLIITGGGSTARRYISALEDNGEIDDIRKDWMGIYTTRVNANFVKIFFKDLAHKDIVRDPNVIPETSKPVLLGGGWEPGASSDNVAVIAAGTLQAAKVINLSNIKHVYDSDPRENPDAQKYEKLTWEEYRSFIPSDWKPGLSTPFDPVASAKAQELGLEVAIMDGHDLESLANYIDGKDFEGTVIS